MPHFVAALSSTAFKIGDSRPERDTILLAEPSKPGGLLVFQSEINIEQQLEMDAFRAP